MVKWIIHICLLASALSAADWPVFRGDAALTGYRAAPLPADLKVQWVFTASDELNSTPVIAGGMVYAASGEGIVYGIDRNTGKMKWHFEAASTIEASPLYVNGMVYCGAFNGAFYALDARTGKKRWNYTVEQRIVGSANLVSSAIGKGIIFGSYDFALYCLDPATGKLRWSYETDNYINGTPAVSGGKLAFGGCDEFLHVLSSSGKALKQVPVKSYVAGSSAISGHLCVTGMHDGRVVAVDLKTYKTAWTFADTTAEEPILSSAAIGPDAVVIGSDDGILRCFEKKDGNVRWQFATGDEIPSSPVICGTDVFCTSKDGFVYRVALNDGKLIWKYNCGAKLVASPAVADGKLFVCSQDGALFAFGQK